MAAAAAGEGERTPAHSKRRHFFHHRHRAQSIIQFQSLDQLEDEVTKGFYETTPPREGSRKRVIIIEVLCGYFWWLVFGKLSSLFHNDSPLSSWQQLSLIVLVLILTFLFASLRILRKMSSNRFSLLCLRVCSLLVLFSDWFYLPLAAVGIGGAACFLSLMSGLWKLSILDKYRKIHYHLLAFILQQVISLWFPSSSHSFFFSSYWGPAIGLVVLCLAFSQDRRTPFVRNKTPSRAHLSGDRFEWVWLGAGFGCHLFVAWAVFGLNGLLSRWSEDNDQSPSTQIIRVIVIAVLCVGVLLGNESNLPLVCSSQWLVMGGVSYLLFVHLDPSTGALGGLMSSLHIISLLPQLYSRLTEYPPFPILSVAMGVYLSLLSTSRLVVGGMAILAYVALVGVVFQWYGLRKWLPLGQELGIVRDNSNVNNGANLKRRPSYTMMVGRVIRKLSTVQEQEEEEDEEEGEEDEEVVEENGVDLRNSIHQRRLLELLVGQEVEMRHFEVKKLRQAMLCLVVMAILCAASG